MNLATGRKITRTHFIYLPIPDDVITQVTAMGASKNMPDTITFGDWEAHELWDLQGDVNNKHDPDYSYNSADLFLLH